MNGEHKTENGKLNETKGGKMNKKKNKWKTK